MKRSLEHLLSTAGSAVPSTRFAPPDCQTRITCNPQFRQKLSNRHAERARLPTLQHPAEKNLCIRLIPQSYWRVSSRLTAPSPTRTAFPLLPIRTTCVESRIRSADEPTSDVHRTLDSKTGRPSTFSLSSDGDEQGLRIEPPSAGKTSRGPGSALKPAWIACHIILFSLLQLCFAQPTDPSWYMAGANPRRTSWVSEEVRGDLQILWYRPFESYISQKTQVITANGSLYISTASGLFAIDADRGALRWTYPTAMPLGNSPTVVNGVVYVGGFDKKIHAIDATSGNKKWTFAGQKGFHTNPLIVGNVVFAGNRDGHIYAIHSATGALKWKYRTGGPILFSAACKSGVIFFASNDSHAYAIEAATGHLVWKSAKLPGAGFHSWWPVIYRDVVIFSGSSNYKHSSGTLVEGIGTLAQHELKDIYPHHDKDPRGTFVGPLAAEPGVWAEGALTIDASQGTVTRNGSTKAITEYLEEKPWRRTYFVLDQKTGREITYDFDGDGKPEYAPILWSGTHSGNRYPPIVGSDDVIYQQNNYMSDRWISGGHVSGWMIGTPFIGVLIPTGPDGKGWGWNAVDEPLAFSGGGDLIYFSNCCDRVGGWVDSSSPATRSIFYSYNNGYGTSLAEKAEGYNQFYHNPDTGIEATSPWASYGKNGVYGWHGDNNPPVPYDGKIFMIRSNAVIAWAPAPKSVVQLPPLEHAESLNGQEIPIPNRSEILEELAFQVEKMVAAGHLRSAYFNYGHLDGCGRCGDNLGDPWHNSSETLYVLTRTLPHLASQQREDLKQYLRTELESFPPFEFNHVGWKGAKREIFDVPPDVKLEKAEPQRENSQYHWRRNPFLFYALWKCAETLGGAKALFDKSRDKLESPPSDEVLIKNPGLLNAFIAGHLGYLKLEQLAGHQESTHIRQRYERLGKLRTSTFTKDSAYSDQGWNGKDRVPYRRSYSVADNFMFLVPELADDFRTEVLDKVHEAVGEYSRLAPYWFVSKAEEGFGENAIVPVYDSHALFQARSLILKERFETLARYLDVPAVEVGDLYYILNLVSLLEAEGGVLKKSVPAPKSLRIRRRTEGGG